MELKDINDAKLPCAEKLAFDTSAQAKAVMASSKYHRGSNPNLKVYLCKHCQLWHLATNQPTGWLQN